MKVVIDGVKYKSKPEIEFGSCAGCAADSDKHLCRSLSSEQSCLTRPLIWKRKKKTLRAGPGQEFVKAEDAMAVAKPGDTIEVYEEPVLLKRYDMQVRFRIRAESQREAVARIKRLVQYGCEVTVMSETEDLENLIDWEVM